MSYPNLTPAELERLALLSEELGEAQQAIGKILRHGYDECHPERRGSCNRHELEKELGDVRAAIVLMLAAGDIHDGSMEQYAKEKAARVGRYMHHQEKRDA